MIRRPPRSTLDRSSAASDVYKRQRPYDRPCRARPRNTLPNPAFHGKSRAAKPPFLPAETRGRKSRFLEQHRARCSEVEFKIVFPQRPLELCVSQGINKTLDSERNFNFESDTKTKGGYFLPWAALLSPLSSAAEKCPS